MTLTMRQLTVAVVPAQRVGFELARYDCARVVSGRRSTCSRAFSHSYFWDDM